MKKRYVQVGLGGRSWMFTEALASTQAAHSELVGICDRNPGRIQHCGQNLAGLGVTVPGYAEDSFERMIGETRPDCVIVTTQDSSHDHYICRAMELGCDVITEKPMTIDAARCQRILDTQSRTGRSCRVAFNYRYAPPRTQLKDLLMSGVIGEVLSVDFHWMLDTSHGADYFRRWHRRKANSGGLLVHKATHHFDLVNWWLSTVPEQVYASGQRRFYTPATADRLGLSHRAERCLDCPDKARCPFALDLRANASLKALYLDHEAHDGYFRDRCVFSADMDIEDAMQLTVRYASGAAMSYSLHAYMPWEGYQITFNGSRGRIEHKCEETVYINGDGSVPGALKHEGTWTRVYPQFAPAYEVKVWQGEGGHGGGDGLLLDDLFLPERKADRYLRAADQRAGAWSILTGIAANRSIESGQAVQIQGLVSGLSLPDYTPMPA